MSKAVLSVREASTVPLPTASTRQQTGKEYLRPLARYRQPQLRRSLGQLATSLAGFLLGWLLMLWCLPYSYSLVLLLALPTAGFLVRLFIIQHDCGHRSFFRSRSANDFLGSLLGVLTMTPYFCWRKQHAAHHATSGDLDRRGRGGEISVMTVREYEQAAWSERVAYRLYRNPLVLLVVGPFWQFVVHQRFTWGVPRTWKKERRSIHYTNLGVAAVTALVVWLVGWQAFLAIHLPVVVLGGSIGVWLFYVQHQFEDTYWRQHADWDYGEAALTGSSYYRLPKVLQWFTANIGLHHIHHLDSRIPNYRLQQCLDKHPEFSRVRSLSFWESLSCLRLKLWDEEERQMVGFPRRK
jgi:omega-6 fatty acid desaturase (delta-12 desaturase)